MPAKSNPKNTSEMGSADRWLTENVYDPLYQWLGLDSFVVPKASENTVTNGCNTSGYENSGDTDSSDGDSDSTSSSVKIRDEDDEEEEEVEFHPHKGKILAIKPFTQISSLSWDKSYDNPTGTSNVKIHYDKVDWENIRRFIYKGVACKAKILRSNEPKFKATEIEEVGLDENDVRIAEHYPTKEQQQMIDMYFAHEDLLNKDPKKSKMEQAEDYAEKNKPTLRSDGDGGIYGFITDVSHEDNGTELEISDWGYCLEDNTKELSFNNMLRSKILEEVIKSYGLVPVVDFTGLRDESISWSNVTYSGTSTTGSGYGSVEGRTQCSPVLEILSYNQNDGGGTPIERLMQGFAPTEEQLSKIGVEGTNYANAVQGKTPKEAYKVLKDGWKYCAYSNNRDKCATESFDKRHSPGLNCGDSSRLLKCAMDIVGCPCCVLHVTNHYMCAVQVDGQWKTADLCYSSGRFPEYNTAGFNK